MERDPITVIGWLRTTEGKPYKKLLPEAMAIAAIGNDAELINAMDTPDTDMPMIDLAAAFYRNGFDATAIQALTDKMLPQSRAAFLDAYAQALAAGSPRALLSFVDAADPRLFTPEVANRLAMGILSLAPSLFDRLTSQMGPRARRPTRDLVL